MPEPSSLQIQKWCWGTLSSVVVLLAAWWDSSRERRGCGEFAGSVDEGAWSRYAAVSHNLTIPPALLLPTILGGFVPPRSSMCADRAAKLDEELQCARALASR